MIAPVLRVVMSCCEGAGRGGILFSILNASPPCPQPGSETQEDIRAPTPLFRVASEVLTQNLRFVRNVPCFRGLPERDQLRLVRNSWPPLLVLGMAQGPADFCTQQPSLLHRILTGSREDPAAGIHRRVSAGDADRIRLFLVECRGLGISVEEAAFLKGALLFGSEIDAPECRECIHALRREAEQALYEHARTSERRGAVRAARLLGVPGTLRAVDRDAVARLFLTPATRSDEHVLALFSQNPRRTRVMSRGSMGTFG